jgi:hypothetical protein
VSHIPIMNFLPFASASLAANAAPIVNKQITSVQTKHTHTRAALHSKPPSCQSFNKPLLAKPESSTPLCHCNNPEPAITNSQSCDVSL